MLTKRLLRIAESPGFSVVDTLRRLRFQYASGFETKYLQLQHRVRALVTPRDTGASKRSDARESTRSSGGRFRPLPPLPELGASTSALPYNLQSQQYVNAAYQYATTSRTRTESPILPPEMSPGLVVQVGASDADADLQKLIRYAAANHLSIAVRTGGNAYSGTSSTHSENIQIDLSEAYKEFEWDPKAGLLRVGVSLNLGDFNRMLSTVKLGTTPDGLFMPTGQCIDSRVGGHAQTGGYGQLSRAFGLFADHIVSADIFTAEGLRRTISPDDEETRDLFWAVFGSGPGNFGIVTHVTVRPRRNCDHAYARAYKAVLPYTKGVDVAILTRLYELVAQWESAPPDYDLSVTFAAAEDQFVSQLLGVGWDAAMTPAARCLQNPPIQLLAVYFQYSNLDGRPDTYDPSWCQRIKDILAPMQQRVVSDPRLRAVQDQTRSKLANADDATTTVVSRAIRSFWTYKGRREYSCPFIKFGGVSGRIPKPEVWAQWAAERLDSMAQGEHTDPTRPSFAGPGLMVFAQCQNWGGANSSIVRNAVRKQTSFNWRNVTVFSQMDCFYRPGVKGALAAASTWQAENLAQALGPDGCFSRDDLRLFGFSHGDRDMQTMHHCYYESDNYKRALRVKAAVDPTGVFSANEFAIAGYREAPDL